MFSHSGNQASEASEGEVDQASDVEVSSDMDQASEFEVSSDMNQASEAEVSSSTDGNMEQEGDNPQEGNNPGMNYGRALDFLDANKVSRRFQ